jgi:tubulin--tyrosine ligase
MSASLSGVPAIALSWGLMTGHKPPTQAILDGAVKSSCAVVKKLWETGWGEGASKVDVFSINVPVSLPLPLSHLFEEPTHPLP